MTILQKIILFGLLIIIWNLFNNIYGFIWKDNSIHIIVPIIYILWIIFLIQDLPKNNSSNWIINFIKNNKERSTLLFIVGLVFLFYFTILILTYIKPLWSIWNLCKYDNFFWSTCWIFDTINSIINWFSDWLYIWGSLITNLLLFLLIIKFDPTRLKN